MGDLVVAVNEMFAQPIVNSAKSLAEQTLGMNPSQVGVAMAAVTCHPALLFVCMLLIGAVSAYDVFCTVAYHESLNMMEANPVGRWLMKLECHDNPQQFDPKQIERVAAFVACKFFGTLLVVIAIQGVYQWRRHLSGPVAIPVTGFQLALFLYLVFGKS